MHKPRRVHSTSALVSIVSCKEMLQERKERVLTSALASEAQEQLHSVGASLWQLGAQRAPSF